MKILEKLNSFIAACAAAMAFFMMVMVIIGIVCRYVQTWSMPESQELAVYAMVYVVMLGSSCAVYSKSHIAVTFLAERLPPALRFGVRMLSYAIMIVFFYLMARYGWDLTMRSMRQLSPITGIPVGYVVASIPFSSVLSILYVLRHMVCEWRDYKEERKTAQEA